MRLMDLLTEAERNKLQGMARKANKNGNKNKTGKNNYSKKNKDDLKNPVAKNKNKKSIIEVNNESQIKRRKKRYIKECPYCASIELEITPNGYYYCNDCGFKVEKI